VLELDGTRNSGRTAAYHRLRDAGAFACRLSGEDRYRARCKSDAAYWRGILARRNKGKPRLLPLERAQGGLAIANGIVGRDFYFRGYLFLMISDPRFGFNLGINKACRVGCLSPAVNKAEEKFELFIHIQSLRKAGAS
jgi:hypothetical protein